LDLRVRVRHRHSSDQAQVRLDRIGGSYIAGSSSVGGEAEALDDRLIDAPS
jgi:hypothetical protein